MNPTYVGLVFEAGEQNSPDAVAKEKEAEIAADFMTTFYPVQVGALETQEFRTMPVPFWLICFSDAVRVDGEWGQSRMALS